ncbi:hypothetical protein E4099_26105, partial [Streptomyces palmae]
SSLCFFFKGTSSQTIRPGDGVSTNLALTFGTLLSSQGTDASFVLTLSGFPPGASLRCFQPYQIRFAFPLSVSGPLLERGGLLAFAFRPFRLYQILFRSVSGPSSIPIPRRTGIAPSGATTTLAEFPR